MERETIQALRQLNNDFYQQHCESFSRSRADAWPGWERVACYLETGRLLDVACGNLRFERFLEQCKGLGAFEFTCVDACPALAADSEDVTFIEHDVLEGLLSDSPLPGGGGFDACVSFGFMHHVPSATLRVELVRKLLESVREGGVVALSFWQFMRDDRLARKALETTRRGCAELEFQLEDNDFLLGWNEVPGAYRYCHSFDDAELEELVQACASAGELIDHFRADGRTGELNGYLVFRRL